MEKLYEPPFLDALETLVIENWEGTVWRVTLQGVTPLTPNLRGARWNPPGVEALYTSLASEVTRAEVQRLLTQPVPVMKPLVDTQLQVALHRVVDLSTPEAFRRIGRDRAEAVTEDTIMPQFIGGAVAWLGIPGLLVPSARAPGTNLVIYTDKLTAADVVERAPA